MGLGVHGGFLSGRAGEATFLDGNRYFLGENALGHFIDPDFIQATLSKSGKLAVGSKYQQRVEITEGAQPVGQICNLPSLIAPKTADCKSAP